MRVCVRVSERARERAEIAAAAPPPPPQASSPHRAPLLMDRFHGLTNASAGVTMLFG